MNLSSVELARRVVWVKSFAYASKISKSPAEAAEGGG